MSRNEYLSSGEKIMKKYHWRVFKCGFLSEEIDGMISLAKNNMEGSEITGIDFIRWQYLDNPAGKAVIWLASEGEMIIGQVVFLPVPVRLSGTEVQGACAVNVITDSNYRNKGIFAILAGKAIKDLEDSGIKMIYGLPNKAAYPTWIKRTGLKDVGSIHDLIKVIKWDGILSKKIGNPVLKRLLSLMLSPFFYSLMRRPDKKWAVEQLNEFGEEFAAFWEESSRDYKNCVVRSRQHLNWRFFECPMREYKVLCARKDGVLKGYIVLREISMSGLKTGWIVDIFAGRTKDGTTAVKLLANEAEKSFKKQGADVIRCRITKVSSAFRALMENGFRKVPFFLMNWPTKMILLCSPDNDIPAPQVDDIYMTMGDNDYI